LSFIFIFHFYLVSLLVFFILDLSLYHHLWSKYFILIFYKCLDCELYILSSCLLILTFTLIFCFYHSSSHFILIFILLPLSFIVILCLC
jgi:hypothetical protein